MSSAGGRAGHRREVGADGWQYLVSISLWVALRGARRSCIWLRAILVREVPSFLLLIMSPNITKNMTAIKMRLMRPTMSIDLSNVNFGSRWGNVI